MNILRTSSKINLFLKRGLVIGLLSFQFQNLVLATGGTQVLNQVVSAQSLTPALIGGKPVPVKQFTSAVYIEMKVSTKLVTECTAVRVGTRHLLTAAHCVIDSSGNIANGAVKGAKIRVSSVNSLRTESVHYYYTVLNTSTHPNFNGDYSTSPDLALIEIDPSHFVKGDTGAFKGVSIAKISQNLPAIGDSVVMMGYGCVQPSGHVVYNKNILNSAINVISDIQTYSNFDLLVTDGGYFDPTKPSICPGDSGGPLYLNPANVNGEEKVIGINSFFQYYDPNKPNVFNFFADATSKRDWIETDTAKFSCSIFWHESSPGVCARDEAIPCVIKNALAQRLLNPKNHKTYGSCKVISCNSGFKIKGNRCVKI